MSGAVDLAVGYASERRQFGRPIGSFQAVQHLLADALRVDGGIAQRRPPCRVGGRRAGARRRAGRRRRAKAYCARAARTVCETAIQVHGGIGNTWECLAHVHLRRALLSADVLGRGRAQPRPGARPPRDRRPTMDFGDSPDEAAFRLRLRAWLDGCTIPACRPPRPTTSTGPARRRGTSRSTTAASSVPPGPRRSAARGSQRLRRHRRRGAGRGRRAAPAEPRLPGGGHPRARRRRRAGPLPARHRQRARPVVPGLQRARRRVGPGVAADPGRPRRRRVRHHRPQGVDELLRRRRVVPGPGPHRSRGGPTQGHLRLRRAHGPARHRAAAPADDQRDHQGVRRGPLRRRPGAGRQHDRASGRGLAAGHDHREPRARAPRAGFRRPLRQAGAGPRGPRCRRPRRPYDTEQVRDLAWAIVESEMLRLHVCRRLSDRLDGIVPRTGGIGGQAAHDLDGTDGRPCRALDRRRPGHPGRTAR